MCQSRIYASPRIRQSRMCQSRIRQPLPSAHRPHREAEPTPPATCGWRRGRL